MIYTPLQLQTLKSSYEQIFQQKEYMTSQLYHYIININLLKVARVPKQPMLCRFISQQQNKIWVIYFRNVEVETFFAQRHPLGTNTLEIKETVSDTIFKICYARTFTFQYINKYYFNPKGHLMNQQPSQTHFKPVYYLQRPHSPKNMLNHAHSAKNISMTMSIGANQTANNFIPAYRTRQELPIVNISQTSISNGGERNDKQLQNQLKVIFKQNVSLRQENQILKRELQRFRKEPAYDSVRSSQKINRLSVEPFNDLRGTIKKEMGELKQMRLKVDMLSKQLKIYEQMVEKQDQRIKKLSHDNNKKNAQINDLQVEVSRLDQLKEKVNTVMRLYNDLQTKFNDHQLEWMKWKQNWLNEKESYLETIRQLQGRKRGD